MNSLLTIVDENDEIIGSKHKDQLSSEDIYRVARLLIINSKNELLLAQRSFVKEKDPGAWGLAVEGTVEAHETYETNIRKEAEEEIGVTLGELELGSKLRMRGKFNHWCQFFITRVDLDINDLTVQEEELEAVAWSDQASLQQEVRLHPEKFGYRFELILEKALPYLN
jgi:isopentenyl-diphosphate Delta-isomerase